MLCYNPPETEQSEAIFVNDKKNHYHLSLDVVIPVYNEETDLEPNISQLREFLEIHCPYRWQIVIADNASNDQTPNT